MPDSRRAFDTTASRALYAGARAWVLRPGRVAVAAPGLRVAAGFAHVHARRS
jgi:hypothetical protein